jgi:hypothetical protein
MINRRLAIVAALSVVELWVLALMIHSVGPKGEPDLPALRVRNGFPATAPAAGPPWAIETGSEPHVVVEVEDASLDVNARPGTTVEIAEPTHWRVDRAHRPLTFEKTSDGVRIAQSAGISLIRRSDERRLDVVVPPGTRLDVRKAGTMHVAGLRTDLVLHTDIGSIVVTDQRGGVVHLTTENGRVELHGVEAPSVDIGSEDGRIVFDRVRADRVAISAGAGRIDIASSVLRGGKLQSGNGRIRLAIDPTSNVTVSARATAGKVTVVPPLMAVRSGDDAAPAAIRVGNGSGRLDVDSADGSITVIAKGE